MKRSFIYIVLIALGVLIVYIILGDVFTVNKNKKNSYAYDLNEFKKVDPALIKYREVKRISTNIPKPKAIDYYRGLLGIAYEHTLQLIDTVGREYFHRSMNETITSISFDPAGKIYLGCEDHIEIYNLSGELLDKWEPIDSTAFITSIAFMNEVIFVADAGAPRILIYSQAGDKLNSFDGTGRIDHDIGFIVPSPYFDIAIDPENQLWVANTGIQSIENYTDDGSLRSWWGEPSFTIEGFAGCCNPAQFSILSDGSFITSEKGLTRIKVYSPSGTLESVVATPDDFDADSEPADLTVDEMDRIYALDITRKMIRKFERKING